MNDEKNSRPLEYAPLEGDWMGPDMRVALLSVGGLLMVLALVLMNVTLASGKYALVLGQSLLATAAADVCFVVACRRARLGWRVAAVVLASPTLWLVPEFFRRWW